MSEATTEESRDEAVTKDARADWNAPAPVDIPRPTYLPAAMAFGITFFLWGFVASPVVLVVGLVVTAAALAGWIGEMRDGQ